MYMSERVIEEFGIEEKAIKSRMVCSQTGQRKSCAIGAFR